jgi:hypothetical protein
MENNEMQSFTDERLKNLIKLVPVPGTLIYIPIWKTFLDRCSKHEQQKSTNKKADKS